MTSLKPDILIGVETECLTAVPRDPASLGEAIALFLDRLRHLAPSLRAYGGLFNPYGKVYCDCGHIELATIECDSPYTVPLIMERLEILAAQAVAQMAAQGVHFVLANNNHSGLLTRNCPTFGDHENYLVDRHPSAFTEEMLPFLVTRLYGGAGGVCYPSGRFVASVRATRMEAAAGGGTTDARAVHSLSREEHHMGPTPTRYRYHLILGDGHRSHFNWALQLGATALAIKAATTDPQLRRELALLRGDFSPDWITTLRQVNVLERAGRPLAIHPLVVRTQRLYLEGARRWAARLDPPPAWIPRLLGDWEQALRAFDQLDRVWLARHLDTFAKYEFYTAVLAEAGLPFHALSRRPSMFRELALLDQSYHEFCNPTSVFTQLERAGALDHRVGARIEPGQEAEPYIPEVNTRARARARLIHERQGQSQFIVDWAYILDHSTSRLLRMYDPFAQAMGEWAPLTDASLLSWVPHILMSLL